MACCRNSLSLTSGPPVSDARRERRDARDRSAAEPRSARNDGSRLLRRVRHTSPARRVRISTSPDEKRPYSTAYGFGSTVTISIASSGKRDLRQAGGRIDEGAGPELHRRLARTAALDADAARHFDHAREQTQRGLQAPAAGDFFEFLSGQTRPTP